MVCTFYRQEPPEALEDLFFEFLEAKQADGCASATIETYKNMFHSVSKWLDVKMSIRNVTDRTIRSAVAKMAGTDLSRNTIRSYTATLKTFFSWLRQEDLTDVDVKLFKGEETIKETYTDADLQRLLVRPGRMANFCEWRNWAIVNVLVNNGCRASTIRNMQIRDVNLEDMVIRYRHTKSRRQQAAPVSPALADVLTVYLKIRCGQPEDWLFPDREGYQMSTNCLRNAIRAYNTARGVKLTSIHAFRHTFARIYLVECNGNALKLQRLLGHSTLDMTKHYVKIYSEDLVKDFEKTSPLEAIKKTSHPRTPTRRPTAPAPEERRL